MRISDWSSDVCSSDLKSRVDQLGLDLMSRNNGTRHETAFTVSIEARDGVTTGISAADRARTISVAIDSSKDREPIVTTGHVFPLGRSEEHPSELQSLMRISYAVFCLKKKN